MHFCAQAVKLKGDMLQLCFWLASSLNNLSNQGKRGGEGQQEILLGMQPGDIGYTILSSMAILQKPFKKKVPLSMAKNSGAL